ncbi:MAG: polysaccharide deacetylase family protein [Bacteroidales bacterium]|nr:polysaccharide deacetylase family protein [Bacteroidales bacterium]
MALIYTHKKTKRVEYIFNLVLNQLLGLEYSLTTDKEVFHNYEGVKFSYSTSPLGSELFFGSVDLLFETGIKTQEFNFIDFEGNKAFYLVYEKASVFPFDPFAASFFLVSRFEEYLPHREDEHNRCRAQESCAFKNGFLHKPLVNIWSQKIRGVLTKRFPELKLKEKQYQFIPTIDVDAAFAYRLKGFFRTTGGYIRALLKMDFAEILERTNVLAGLEPDPFDTFAYQLELHKKQRLNPIYFFLLADYGVNDKNIPHYNRQFQVLIKSIADYADIGIHPSYASFQYPAKLKAEVQRLSAIVNKEIINSRQHFLRLVLPTTYRKLISLDIMNDFSMGYASEPGFRAGICTPFYFYDLDLESETKLLLHPFTVMDGTLRDYHGHSTEEAIEIIKSLIDEVKAVNGTFISLWHNDSLSNAHRWSGWRKVYEELITYAIAK